MSSQTNLQETLEMICDATISLLKTDIALVRLFDAKLTALRVEAALGAKTGMLAKGSQLVPDARPGGWVASNNSALAIEAMAFDEDPYVRELAQREKTVSYLGIPINADGRRIGVIETYSRGRALTFSGEDVEVLAALGNQAAMATEIARLSQAQVDIEVKLRQLERHKSDFVAMVAHELRTPLTSIKGFAQLLLRQNACARPDAVEKYSAIIEAESNRMMAIINEILDISDMEAGLLEMQRQPLSIAELMRQVVEEIDQQHPGHTLELSLPPALPLIRGDAAKIKLVLVNLIQNAVRYSPEREPIQIGALADNEGVTVWVNDMGRSIPAEKFDHIFNSYRVVDEEEANRSRSSGLWLYASKNFVEAQGGKMWVESEEGKGAKFLFKLYY